MDFPEGYEYEWEVGEDIDCLTLTGSVGELSFEPTTKVKPEGCTGCRCLCECVCATVTKADGTTCVGKLCWDYSQDAYVGTVTCDNYEESTYDLTVKIGPKGLYCDDYLPDSDYDDCDPYDETCVIVLDAPDLGFDDDWQEITAPCEERNLDYSWTAGYGDDEVTVAITCATCNEECAEPLFLCCANPRRSAPRQLFIEFGQCPCTESGVDCPPITSSCGVRGSGTLTAFKVAGRTDAFYYGVLDVISTGLVEGPDGMGGSVCTAVDNPPQTIQICMNCDLGIDDPTIKVKWRDYDPGDPNMLCTPGDDPELDHGITFDIPTDCTNPVVLPPCFGPSSSGNGAYVACCDPLLLYAVFQPDGPWFGVDDWIGHGGWVLITE